MRRRMFSEGRFFKFLLIGLVAVTAFGFIVMGLWNGVLAVVLHISTITFWQALGLLVLSKILFGGFPGKRGGFRGGPEHDKRRAMWEKIQNMSPEERAEFKRNWKDNCRSWKRGNFDWKDESRSAQTNAAETATE